MALGAALPCLACGPESTTREPTPPEVSCEPEVELPPAGDPLQVDLVTATLVDQDDVPVPFELVQVCGLDLCINGETAEDGGVAIAPLLELTRPAFKFGGGIESARFALLIDEAEVDLGQVRTVRLPDLDTAVPLDPGSEVSSGELSLRLAPDTEVSIDRLTFRTDEEQGLRAVRVPLEDAPVVVDPDLGFEIVYATTPTDTRFCPPAELSIPNSEDWPADSEVEVWLHGVDIAQELSPYGGWAKISDARVSEDGERIETGSPGLFGLGVLGFKRRP